MLILVRHGRTLSNASGIVQGRVDNPLDEIGLAQAAQIVAAVGRVDRVITSSLIRARQTAAQFAAPATIDDRWIELDFGILDGMPLADVPAETWKGWRSDPMFAPPGGESMQSLDRRVRAAAADALELARAQVVVVVSHVSPIKAAVAWALGGDSMMSWRMHLDHAGVSRIVAGPNGAELHSFNEVLYTR